MKNLEKFIREHRDEFDVHELPDAVWQKVSSKIQTESKNEDGALIIKIRPKHLLRIAAALAFLLVSVFLIQKTEVFNTDQLASSDPIIEELDNIESYYSLHFQKAKSQFASESSYESIKPDVDQIDAAIKELKDELIGVPSDKREQVIHAIIQNYKYKINILEKVLEHEFIGLEKEKQSVYEI